MALERGDRDLLHPGIERGLHADAGPAQQMRGEMRREAGIEREAPRGAEHRGGQPGEARAIALVRQRAGAPGDLRSASARLGQQRGEQQRIVARQRRGRLAEQPDRGRADALRLAAEAGEVEIGLEDLVLGPAPLERPGGAHLAQLLDQPARSRRGEIGREIGGDLHRQRARAARAPPFDAIAQAAERAEPVDAAVPAEAPVLGGDQRVARHRRHCGERCPGEAARGEIDARAVDQPPIAIVKPSFGRAPAGARAGIVGHRRRQRRPVRDAEQQQQRRNAARDQPAGRRHAAPAARAKLPGAPRRPALDSLGRQAPGDVGDGREAVEALPPAHRCATVTGALGSIALTSGEYIASTRVGGSPNRPAPLSRIT